ncbi:phage terminase small subunit P27 family [Escherichia coli]
MPALIPRACRVRGCRHTTTDPSGYCESHKSKGWKQYKPGQSRHQRGYGSKWDVIRGRVPEWFAEEDLPLATIMWQLTTKELCGQGLLCVTDLAVLERWCVAYEFWRRAVKNIARQGNTITGAMGGMVKNPELTAKKEQESEMSSTGAMLGLDPSSRQRLIGLAGQKKATNPFLKIIES